MIHQMPKLTASKLSQILLVLAVGIHEEINFSVRNNEVKRKKSDTPKCLNSD